MGQSWYAAQQPRPDGRSAQAFADVDRGSGGRVPAATAIARVHEYRAHPVRGRLTGRGAVLLLTGATVLAGLVGIGLAGHRTGLFGLVFTVVAAVCAALVRRRDLATTVIAPPIVYCVALLLISFIDAGRFAGGLASREVVYLADAFVTGAPAIWAGTAAAGVVAVWRRAGRSRRSRR